MTDTNAKLNAGQDSRWTRYVTPLILGAMLVAGAAIRAYGSNFGLPYVYHPDEPAIVDVALRIERTGDFNPHWFNYPSLYMYVQFGIIVLMRAWAGLHGLALDGLTAQGMIYQAGRLVTVLIGTATIAVVYATGRRLFNERVGLWAALILAGTALHIEHSHYITTDVPCAFFAVGCLCFAARALDTRSLADLTLSALMAGLAAGAKYNAGLVLVTTGLAFLLTRRHWRELLDPALIAIPLGAAVGFLGSTPYAIFDYDAFKKGVEAEIEHYRLGHHGAEGSDNWRWFALYLYREGMYPILAWTTALGMICAAVVRRTRKDLLLLPFPLLYYAMLSVQRVRFARNLMPIVPFLAIFAARLTAEVLDSLAARIPWGRLGKPLTVLAQVAAVTGLAFLLLRPPVQRQWEIDYWLTQEDTRTIAKGWIEENIPDGTAIAVEAYTPWLEFSYKPGTTQRRYRLDRYWRLADSPLSFYQQKGYQYIIVSSIMYGRYFVDRTSYPKERSFYESLFAQWPLVKEFKGHPVPMHDPVLRVYRVPAR